MCQYEKAIFLIFNKQYITINFRAQKKYIAVILCTLSADIKPFSHLYLTLTVTKYSTH